MAIQLTYKLDLSATAASSTLSSYAARVGTASISTAQNTAIFSTDTGNGADVWFSSDQAGLSPIDAKLVHWSDANSVFAFDVEITTVSAISGATIYLHVGSKPGGYGANAYDANAIGIYPLATNFNDLTVNANNGSAVGGVTTGGLTGPDGFTPASDFDGADDEVTIAAGLVSGSQNRTISGWIKPDVTTTGYIFHITDGTAGIPGARWAARLSGSALRIEISGSGYTSSLTYTTGSWQFFAITLDGTTLGDHLLIRNSVSESATGANAVNTDIAYTAGISKGQTTAEEFNGGIADIRFYDRARPEAELNADYLLQGPSAATYWTVTDVSPASTSPIRRIKYGKLSGIIGNPLRGYIG